MLSRYRIRGVALALFLLTVLVTALPISARAADSDTATRDFYRGQRIRLIVGFGAGGGYDIWARLVSRHIGKYIPGNPSIIVENRPGAGSVLAGNSVFNTEPKDGTVIATVNPNIVMLQALGESVQFDARKFKWLGSGSVDYLACVVRSDSGIKSVADLMNTQLPIASQAVGSLSYAVPALLNLGLGTKFKIVPGYTSVPDVFLAIQKNEAKGACQAYISALLATQRHLLEGATPLLKPIIIVSSEVPAEPFMAGVPTADSLAKTDNARGLFRVLRSMAAISYPYVMAPDVPQERVDAVRTALAKTFADADFIADAGRAGQFVSPHSGAEVAGIVAEMLATPAEIVAELKPVLGSR